MTDRFLLRAGLVLVLVLPALGGCVVVGSRDDAPPADAPAQVEERVREPAEAEANGAQVYALQNPAVVQLSGQASEAEAAGDYAQAEMLLERALRIQPRNPEVLQHMAEVQLALGHWDQAIGFATRSYDTGARVGELCARNWRTIGLANERLDDGSAARAAARRLDDCMSNRPPRQ